MNVFEWLALGLILFGMVIPFWIMTVLASKTAARQQKEGSSSHRVLRYNEVMDYLHTTLKKSSDQGQNGASLVAAIRELKSYPEHKDLTILYLEEITITGTSKFDDLAKAEIDSIETQFLGLKDE